ncbi:MAG: PVC-type heme-binding CxxCH protein [Adhaeribacter sp.]
MKTFILIRQQGIGLLLLAALVAGGGACSKRSGAPLPAASTPAAEAKVDSSRFKKALASFRLEPGLRIELMVAEPLVVDPVAFAFDEDRLLYVVEDRGYPDPAEGGNPTRLGRIARLEDTNGDGRYDRRTEFATGLTYPNGVLPWKGGVFVTVAPDILYLKDTNGDGVADVRRVVLTGFNDTQTAQIRVSTPTLGLDGWVYVTSGLNGGKVTSPEHPDRPPVVFSAADGRFHPETLVFETTGGKSQYGLTFDSYGRRFGCSNRHPIRQIVLEPGHLRRNPHLSFTETMHNVSKVEAEATVYPISGAITSADFIPKLIGRSHTGTFTSASGVLIFNGTALTPAHQGNAFICESAQNLVQRQVLEPQGVTFRAELPYEGRDFLASTDEWFRPVFVQAGPEGALYVADMHRKVIDHPSYVPVEARAGLDFESGKADGRIYRIVRTGYQHSRAPQIPDLGASASAGQLVAALESAQDWVRATAHRLLLERGDPKAVSALQRCVRQAPLGESRTRALWLLQSLGALNEATVLAALADQEAGVREQGLRLAEGLGARHPALAAAVVAAAGDPAPRVRFTAALVLGSLEGEAVVPALAQVAARDGADRWVRAAVLSGIGQRMPAFLAAFRAQRQADPVAFAAVMQDLGRLFGNGATLADCRLLLKDVLRSPGAADWRMATVLGLAEGVSGRPEMKSPAKGLLYALQGQQAPAGERKALEAFIGQAGAQARREGGGLRLRTTATALLGYTHFDQSRPVLQKLLDARNPPELQLEAVAALARLGDARGGALLTQKSTWTSYTPRVRAAVLAALVSKPAFVQVLFQAIEQGVVGAPEVSSLDRERLMKDRNPQVSAQARALFQELEGGGRMQVYQDLRPILDKPADAALGKPVFARSCSACHTYAGVGGKVGPDLTGVKNQPADALLLHILVPNYEVYPAYQAISVQTSDGRSLSGWITAETENSLTLRTAFGTDESVLRSHITSLKNSGSSLMPDGLERTMSREELAALIAFLKSGGS